MSISSNVLSKTQPITSAMGKFCAPAGKFVGYTVKTISRNFFQTKMGNIATAIAGFAVAVLASFGIYKAYKSYKASKAKKAKAADDAKAKAKAKAKADAKAKAKADAEAKIREKTIKEMTDKLAKEKAAQAQEKKEVEEQEEKLSTPENKKTIADFAKKLDDLYVLNDKTKEEDDKTVAKEKVSDKAKALHKEILEAELIMKMQDILDPASIKKMSKIAERTRALQISTKDDAAELKSMKKVLLSSISASLLAARFSMGPGPWAEVFVFGRKEEEDKVEEEVYGAANRKCKPTMSDTLPGSEAIGYK